MVLLEFPDEGAAYLSQPGCNQPDESRVEVVSLDPKVKVWMEKQGIATSCSLEYFSSESHARSLRKSESLLNWLDTKFALQDGLGISGAYSNALLWYSRYTINHFLWLAEILSDVREKHPDAVISAYVGDHQDSRTPLVDEEERYLGLMAKSYCNSREVIFESFNGLSRQEKNTPSNNYLLMFRRLGFKIVGRLHRAGLRKMGVKRPFFSITHGYRGDYLAQELRESFPDIPWVIRGEVLHQSGIAVLCRRVLNMCLEYLSRTNNRLYMGEVWLRVLQETTREDHRFILDLDESINVIAKELQADPNIFCHRGVQFGDLFIAKLRTGIGQALRYLQREVAALDETLDLVKPTMVLTPFGRRSFHALGELAERKGIPGLLISHGSFTPTYDELSEMAWRYHSLGLLHGSYRYSALQTPLAEEFAEQTDTNTEFLKTGPLIWGLPMHSRAVDRSSQSLKKRLVHSHENCRVLLHAGTPKYRRGLHFHVYETPDEYIQALRDLISAVDREEDVFLIIKYRPNQLSVDELISLLPKSDNYSISVEETFLDVLAISDLLVSFSSTTIEEALQNLIPVLLYGGDGRYKHINAQEIIPDQHMRPGVVYSISNAENLASGIRKILDANGKSPLPKQFFSKYVYQPNQTIPLPQWIDNLLSVNRSST